MNVASTLLQSDWLVYCKAMNLPCAPPDKHSEITVAMMICVSIAIIIFIIGSSSCDYPAAHRDASGVPEGE